MYQSVDDLLQFLESGAENITVYTVNDDEEMNSILKRIIEDRNSEKDRYKTKEFNENINNTREKIKDINEILEHLESKLEEARNTDDMDIMFDALEKVIPIKQQYLKELELNKAFYVIQICMLHKKIENLDKKIKEIRPLYHELDELVLRNIKIVPEIIDERIYIDIAKYCKSQFIILDHFESSLKKGYYFDK